LSMVLNPWWIKNVMHLWKPIELYNTNNKAWCKLGHLVSNKY
jgi:hypothetical protein